MSTDLLIEGMTALLAPLGGDNPCGVALRSDGTYKRITEARRADDPNLPLGIWEHAPKRADWLLVEELCQDALSLRSKDLQIAAWLTDAWLHQRGLTGLIEGLQLMTGLVEQYWDDIYPRIEQGNMEGRLASFDWLNKHVAEAFGLVPIAAGASAAGRLFTLAEWELVKRHECFDVPPPSKPRSAAPVQGEGRVLTRAQFNAAVAATPAHFYEKLQVQLHGAVIALDQLGVVLESYMGADAPSLTAMEDRIDACYQAIQELAGVPWQVEEVMRDEDEEEIMGSRDDLAGTQTPSGDVGGPIRSRDDAYRQLETIANYLMRTEPHSPVPYLLLRAASWGNMPLGQLLPELLESESDLKQLNRLLGTRRA